MLLCVFFVRLCVTNSRSPSFLAAFLRLSGSRFFHGAGHDGLFRFRLGGRGGSGGSALGSLQAFVEYLFVVVFGGIREREGAGQAVVAAGDELHVVHAHLPEQEPGAVGLDFIVAVEHHGVGRVFQHGQVLRVRQVAFGDVDGILHVPLLVFVRTPDIDEPDVGAGVVEQLKRLGFGQPGRPLGHLGQGFLSAQLVLQGIGFHRNKPNADHNDKEQGQEVQYLRLV